MNYETFVASTDAVAPYIVKMAGPVLTSARPDSRSH